MSGLLATALLVALAPAQQPQAPPKEKEEKKEEEAKKEKAPARSFRGKIALRSSRQETDTAGAGFKGVGEDGAVQQAALASQPSGADHEKIVQMAAFQLSGDELKAFLQQGGLQARPGKEKKP